MSEWSALRKEPLFQWKDLPIAFLIGGVAVAGGVLAARISETTDLSGLTAPGSVVARIMGAGQARSWFDEFSDLQQSFVSTRLQEAAADPVETGSIHVVRTTTITVPASRPVAASAAPMVSMAPQTMPTAAAMAFGGLAPAPWLKITVTGGAAEVIGSGGRQKTAAVAPRLKSAAPGLGASGPALAYAAEPSAEDRFKSVFRDGDDGLTAPAQPKLPANLHSWAYSPLPASVNEPRHQKCLAEAIYFEARGESERGQAAVAQVVLNRVRNPAYPDNICDVVYQQENQRDHCQFSFACDGRKEVVTEPDAWKRAVRIATEVTAGRSYDREVGDATHYHASWVRPDWKNTMKRVAVIGVHRFYRTYGGGWI